MRDSSDFLLGMILRIMERELGSGECWGRVIDARRYVEVRWFAPRVQRRAWERQPPPWVAESRFPVWEFVMLNDVDIEMQVVGRARTLKDSFIDRMESYDGRGS